MDTTAHLSPLRRPDSRRSRLRKWATRLFALAALGAALGSTALIAAEAAGEDPPPPVPADLMR